jgi:hypothetical protein
LQQAPPDFPEAEEEASRVACASASSRYWNMVFHREFDKNWLLMTDRVGQECS